MNGARVALSTLLRPSFLGATLIAVFLIRSGLAMQADGTTVDEPVHLAYGERGINQGTWARDDESLNSKMPVTALNAIPEVVASHFTDLSERTRLSIARAVTVALSLAIAFLVWRWATELFGRQSGLLALLLYTFCPNVLAHSHLVTTDIATALAMFASTYFFWRYSTAPSRSRLAVAAAAFGLAQLTKNSALLLIPIFAGILTVTITSEALRARRQGTARLLLLRQVRRRAFRSLALLGVFGLAAIAALNLGFGFEHSFSPLKSYDMISPVLKACATTPLIRDIPVPLPAPYVDGLDMVTSDSTAASWSYLHGDYSQHGFRSYFFWAFLVKVPVATQILFLLAVGLWATGRVRAVGAEAFLILPILVVFAYLSLLFRLDIGLRYFLPAFPFLFVFAARCAAPVVWSGAGVQRWKPALMGALLAWLAASSWLVHPDYLTYFNEIAGGPSNGGQWLIDSNLDWGQRGEYLEAVYAAHSPVRVWIDPSGPLAGRIAVGLTGLVGTDPVDAARHAWLRENFKPTAVLGRAINVYDVSQKALDQCCAALPDTWTLEEIDNDLAAKGKSIGGGDDVVVRALQRLNDGMIGANDSVDAAHSGPVQKHAVSAWFGIRWPQPQSVGRIVVFPGFFSRGPEARKWLALDYVLQFWDGRQWKDLPGTDVTSNRALRRTHTFAPVRTTQVRILIERERNERGLVSPTGGFRAACLELAAYRE